MGPLILLAAFVVCGLAVYAMFRPLPRLLLGSRKAAFAALGLSFVLVIISAALMAPPTITVTKAELGASWPLTVDAVDVDCGGGLGIAILTPDAAYPLSEGFGEEVRGRPLRDLKEIWLEFSPLPGVKARKNYGPLYQRAVEACRAKGLWKL